MNEANLVKDYLPHPETPINIALPRLWRRTQIIRQIWRIASSKNTRSSFT